MKKAGKAPKPQKPVPSPWPDLFVYYRGQRADGGVQENNMILHNVAPLVEIHHFAAVQDFIMKQEGFAMVRIVYWQRAEGISNPPKEKAK